MPYAATPIGIPTTSLNVTVFVLLNHCLWKGRGGGGVSVLSLPESSLYSSKGAKHPKPTLICTPAVRSFSP